MFNFGRKKVLIGIPAYNFQVHSGLILSLVREIKKSKHEIIVMSNHSCFIAHSRNEIVRAALKERCDYLLFWDADTEILVSDFIDKMISLSQSWHNAIICAPYRMKTPDKKFNLIVRKTGNIMDYITELKPDPFEVDAGGTGFMLIPCKIFEKFTDPYFQMTATKEGFMPEDWEFCFKAKENGYKTVADPSLKTRHWGFYVWNSHE